MKITEFCKNVFQNLEDKGEGQKDFGIAFQHMLKDQGDKEQDSAVPDITHTEYKKILRWRKKGLNPEFD